jgi:hypothetical protein
MQIVASMSPDEMEEMILELQGMLGDNPETLAAIEHVMKEIPKMKAADVQYSLKNMI